MSTRPKIVNILLPKFLDDPEKWSTIVTKHKDFRLLSLRTAPAAFSSTYAREVSFTSDVWEERLRNPLANTFVAVTATDDANSSSATQDEIAVLLRGQIVSSMVLIGPKEESFVQASKSPWETMNADSEPVAEDGGEPAILYYHMNGVFTGSAFRDLGLAKSLIEQALRLADALSKGRGVEATRFTVLVDKDNIAATKLYETCGFNIVAEETMKSPRKEKPDGTPIPERDIEVYTLERWSNFSS